MSDIEIRATVSGTTETHVDAFGLYEERRVAEHNALVRSILMQTAMYYEAQRNCRPCQKRKSRLNALYLKGEWPK